MNNSKIQGIDGNDNLLFQKLIWVNENWYPNYDERGSYPNYNGGVLVKLYTLIDGRFRVIIMGADDFGLEKDMDTEEEAFKLYSSIMDWVTIKELTERYGMVHV